ncbi:hypothetical protein BAUCODRAFT_33583 [Baudoinia panamericana UAMH 10762]|uniref:Uncharacterized protein n=1 Tax=Baudoinia panamericana (strain UAMH 10762) TaxID=717646 RepID=M2MHX0_BAUPA|nr:uncharacterized protein BAUCODRAFT_33583 [Baudoinia panamericana UAMH 10762]EMC96236.1 hypothetical protein BAUCODRAFT_33583 [Baudoinia panamericana UAMH 10762]
MEEPPAVPAKDTPKGADKEGHATAGASKRKRKSEDDTVYEYNNGQPEPVNAHAHTPKRSRKHAQQAEYEAPEETTPAGQRNLRRKKKVNNLSTLNLRHAAQRQQAEQQQLRGSKFQEGSLTDKPSLKPPSVFTRMMRTESGNIKQVDELMEGYNEAPSAEDDSMESAIEHEKASTAQQVGNITAHAAPRPGSNGFLSFGRSFAQTFSPVSLWNKVFAETKEDLLRQQVEEAKRKQKAEAEARYAQLKAAGQLGLQPVSNFDTELRPSAEGSLFQDSALDMSSTRTSTEHKHTVSTTTQLLLPPPDDVSSLSGGEVPETTVKPKAMFKSRFFKRPSMSSLKDGLKRVRSDFNLAAAANGANRESSSSVSPVKPDFGYSTVRRSESKFDLKRQHKLSKRVSNLEAKLQQARRELGEALVEASPAPKFTNKYERFTPQSTLKRPKFVPGKLPSLPSERVLMAEQMGFGDDEASPEKVMSEAAMDDKAEPSPLLPRVDEGEETIKAPTKRQYPVHASALFEPAPNNIDQPPTAESVKVNDSHHNSINFRFPITDDPEMDPNSVTKTTSDGVPETAKPANYASLDAKLKALDKNVKLAAATKKPAAKSKKRKSTDEGDKIFKPGNGDDDDGWDEPTPRKKRKSTGNVNGDSPQPRRTTRVTAKKASPQGSKTTNGTVKGGGVAMTTKEGDIEAHNEDDEAAAANDDLVVSIDTSTTAELIADTPMRTSLESQGQPLEPLYEVEEELSAVPLTSEPTKPSAKANPARYGHYTARSRSSSPFKRADTIQPGAEEQVITRAAEAAQDLRGRLGSLPPTDSIKEIVTVVDETVSVIPGEGGVPALPDLASNGDDGEVREEVLAVELGIAGKALKRGDKKSFEWPEDVF